ALSHHDVAAAARQLDAAPPAWRGWEWRHLRVRLDDSMSVFPEIAGGSQFLIRDPKGIRIASLTPASLRLTDLGGNELFSPSFRSVSHAIMGSPLPTRQGLMLVPENRAGTSRNSVQADSADSTTCVALLLDDEGHRQIRLQGPAGARVALTAVSPDGARVAVI